MKIKTEIKERKVEYKEYNITLTDYEMDAVLQALEVAYNPGARMSAKNAAISEDLFKIIVSGPGQNASASFKAASVTPVVIVYKSFISDI